MSADMAVRLQLEEIELPAGPGSVVKVLLTAGRDEFFGPEGIRHGQGFSVKVNDDLWRAVLTSFVGGAESTLIALTIEGRYSS